MHAIVKTSAVLALVGMAGAATLEPASARSARYWGAAGAGLAAGAALGAAAAARAYAEPGYGYFGPGYDAYAYGPGPLAPGGIYGYGFDRDPGCTTYDIYGKLEYNCNW